jgi:inositol-pentakisphosphate 2-kinase
MQLIPDEWTAFQQGNMHVVFQYNGVSAELNGKVLKLRKLAQIKNNVENDQERYWLSYELISVLFGEEHNPEVSLVEISEDLLLRFQSKLSDIVLDPKQTHAVIMPDLTRLFENESKALTVEIKPKWAHMSKSARDDARFQQRCRYCMHQHFKRMNGKIEKVSEFCPLDLYSMDEERMKRALEKLINCPQNNLKLFANGSQISYENIADAIRDAIPADGDALDIFIDALVAVFKKVNILETLKRHQKRLSPLEIDDCYKRYCLLEKRGMLSKLHEAVSSHDYWIKVVHSYMGIIPNDSSEKDDITLLVEFLLLVGLKDLSIMISIAMISDEALKANGDVPNIKVRDKVFRYSVKVLDLDIKSPDKIPHYQDLDKRIVAHYEKIKEELGISMACFD